MLRLLLLASLVLLPSAPAPSLTSFEGAPAGEFTSVSTELGKLTADKGHAVIHTAHARTGAQCLRILGGEGHSVELEIAKEHRKVAEIQFWAERWTSKSPFAFQVEAHTSAGWKQVYDGADAIRVGARFLSDVRIAVDGKIDKLRFTCTSPEGGGILIDDLAFVTPGPATLEGVRFTQPMLPVLVGNEWNPVGRIDLEVSGTLGNLDLSRITVNLDGTTDLGVLDKVALFQGPATLDYRNPAAALDEAQRFGKVRKAAKGDLEFRGSLGLTRGTTHLWIAVSLARGADLDARIVADASHVQIESDKHVPIVAGEPVLQRLGVALRSAGDDGSNAFRIPGLVTTNEGTLIGVYDVRWRGWGDLPGDIDVGMSRSTDGGRTWEDQRIVMDIDGRDKGQFRGDGVGDPAVLVDRETNAIHVIATWSHGNRSWNGSGPGLEPEETGQLMLVSSTDDGKSWGDLRNLTREVKDPSWSFLLQGPGRGITMGDGTLVFPAQFQLSPEEKRMPHSSVLISQDHGKTWTMGTGAKPNTTEAAVVELRDGELMLNMRDNRGGSRAIHMSKDLGATWAEHATTRSALIEPVCMASLIHVRRELDGKADGRLIFSNPNVGRAPRRHMSLQGSDDFGATWLSDALLLDEGASAGYSCLTMIDEDTIGILYEGSRAHMTFQRIPLIELFPTLAKSR